MTDIKDTQPVDNVGYDNISVIETKTQPDTKTTAIKGVVLFVLICLAVILIVKYKVL